MSLLPRLLHRQPNPLHPTLTSPNRLPQPLPLHPPKSPPKNRTPNPKQPSPHPSSSPPNSANAPPPSRKPTSPTASAKNSSKNAPCRPTTAFPNARRRTASCPRARTAKTWVWARDGGTKVINYTNPLSLFCLPPTQHHGIVQLNNNNTSAIPVQISASPQPSAPGRR